MATTFRLAGLEEYVAALRDLAPGLANDVRGDQQAEAQSAAQALRAAYPSRTGQLRASVQVRTLGTNSPAKVATEVTVTAPYVRFVEFGTRNTRPQPTFGPTMRRSREAFLQDMKSAVRARGLKTEGR